MRHVDIVWNRPVENERRVVTRIYRNGDGQLAFKQLTDQFGEFSPKGLFAKGEALDPHRPEHFLEHLHEAIADQYLYATTPHEDDDCPFPNGSSTIFNATG